MTTIPNPDDWKDVFTILAVVAMMSVPSWFAIRAHKTSEAILAQTKNGHQEPMRVDIDRMLETTDRALETAEATRQELGAHRRETRKEFAALREDLGDERTARRDGDISLRDEIHDRHPAVTQERTTRQAGDQGLRKDLDAHLDDGTAHETR